MDCNVYKNMYDQITLKLKKIFYIYFLILSFISSFFLLENKNIYLVKNKKKLCYLVIYSMIIEANKKIITDIYIWYMYVILIQKLNDCLALIYKSLHIFRLMINI